MAMETPIVATRIAGIPRVLTDGESGLLVPSGDLPSLTRAIGRAIDDLNLRERLATAARRTIDERYSFDARMKKVAAVYDDLLGRKRTAAETQ
jgi:glycosyltransferase involved in cell wall biosynthesis